MATNSILLPPLAERESTPPLLGTIYVKHEQHELPNTTITNAPPTKTTQNQQEPPQLPHFIDSIAELGALSVALSTFQRRYEELQHHLDYIRTTIDSKLPAHLQNIDCQSSSSNQLTIIPLPETPLANSIKPSLPESANSEQKTKTPFSNPIKPSLPESANSEQQTKTPFANAINPTLPKSASSEQKTKIPFANSISPSLPESANSEQKTKTPFANPIKSSLPESANSEQKTDNNDKSSRSEVQNICEIMCSRSLRRYLVTHLTSANKLREEVPKALKFASNPSKLVLECFGRFFLQGSKAYTKDSPMIQSREASVLVLECFLLMGCDGVEMETSVVEEAGLAAMAWRKRLAIEGGLLKACEIDAQGLLLLIGCFGIPSAFKNEDVRDLVRASNARRISDALRRSRILVRRIPEIIEGLKKNKMEVDAVDAVYAFGIEDMFPPQIILTSFLQESKETWKKKRKAAQGSFPEVNEANKKQLANLKSVIKCLENHKIDPSKLLPGWQMNEKILSLEKDIADLDKKMRENTITKRKADETESSKKLRTQEVKRSRFGDHGLQQHKVSGYMDSKSSYDPMNLLDAGLPAHVNSYSGSPSVMYRSGVSSLPDNFPGSIAGSRGVLLAPGVGPGMSAGSGAVHGGMLVDSVGQMSNRNGQPYGWGGDYERLVGHSFVGQPPLSSGVSGLYRPSQSLEGFAGLPNTASVGVSSRSSASDLYQFADTVLESESYRTGGGGSRAAGTVHSVVPAHHSSYLY